MTQEILDIVNENDEVVGQATRSEIKKKGLLHREIHIWIFNDNGQVLLQKRSKNKDTYPELLDVSVGGHVQPGESYLETAIRETEEELGLKIEEKDLVLLEKSIRRHFDHINNLKCRSMDNLFAFKFNGTLNELKFDEGEIIEFQWWNIDNLFSLSDEEKGLFVPITISEEVLEVVKKLRNL